jgi:hypothetical protein
VLGALTLGFGVTYFPDCDLQWTLPRRSLLIAENKWTVKKILWHSLEKISSLRTDIDQRVQNQAPHE